MSETRWTCTLCDATGVVEYEDDAGVYEVLNLIRDDHAARSLEPSHYDVAKIRVEPIDFGDLRGGSDG